MVEEVDGKTYLNFPATSSGGPLALPGYGQKRIPVKPSTMRCVARKPSPPAVLASRYVFLPVTSSMRLELTSRDLISTAYQSGVTMGGTLHVDADRRPTFLTWAVADPNTHNYNACKSLKAGCKTANIEEQVYDVACSDGLSVDTNTHRCPDNGAKVNLDDCSRTANVGASELKTLWQDPNFVPGQEAFYYVRVLENPVCRWSTWDAIRSGEQPRPDLPATIQERAWSSPIWYSASTDDNNFVH